VWDMIPDRARDFSCLQNVLCSSGAHPTSCSIGTGVLSLAVKWQRHVFDHLTPSSTEVRNEWTYISVVLYSNVVIHRDSFTFYQD
jgi:hypothetical protein